MLDEDTKPAHTTQNTLKQRNRKKETIDFRPAEVLCRLARTTWVAVRCVNFGWGFYRLLFQCCAGSHFSSRKQERKDGQVGVSCGTLKQAVASLLPRMNGRRGESSLRFFSRTLADLELNFSLSLKKFRPICFSTCYEQYRCLPRQCLRSNFSYLYQRITMRQK